MYIWNQPVNWILIRWNYLELQQTIKGTVNSLLQTAEQVVTIRKAPSHICQKKFTLSCSLALPIEFNWIIMSNRTILLVFCQFSLTAKTLHQKANNDTRRLNDVKANLTVEHFVDNFTETPYLGTPPVGWSETDKPWYNLNRSYQNRRQRCETFSELL